MPGGDEQAYERLEPILTRIAAQVDDGPCVTYVGRRSAGHYVKMVHNGIEYGDMQLIAEAYSYLAAAGYAPDELAEIFASWNESELESYLIQITADIFKVRDAGGDGFLVDAILDQAGQKGTGRWTSRDALELGTPIPTIDAAVWVAPYLGPQDRTGRGGSRTATRRRADDQAVRWLGRLRAAGALRGQGVLLCPGHVVAARRIRGLRLRGSSRRSWRASGRADASFAPACWATSNGPSPLTQRW